MVVIRPDVHTTSTSSEKTTSNIKTLKTHSCLNYLVLFGLVQIDPWPQVMDTPDPARCWSSADEQLSRWGTGCGLRVWSVLDHKPGQLCPDTTLPKIHALHLHCTPSNLRMDCGYMFYAIPFQGVFEPLADRAIITDKDNWIYTGGKDVSQFLHGHGCSSGLNRVRLDRQFHISVMFCTSGHSLDSI